MGLPTTPAPTRSFAFVASALQTLVLDYLPQSIEGLASHLTGLLFRMNATITPHATIVDYGYNLINHMISRIALYDRNNEPVIELTGPRIRDAAWLVSGARPFADPADTTPAGGAEVKVAEFYYPFHGGIGGIRGLKEFRDGVQPTARFHMGSARIEVTWLADFAGSGADASVSLDVIPIIENYPERYMGVDVRLLEAHSADQTDIRVPVPGRLLALALSRDDRDLAGDYTSLRIDQHQLANLRSPAELAALWNLTAAEAGDRLSTTTPEMAPLVYPSEGAGIVEGSIQPEGGQLYLRSVHEAAITHHMIVVTLREGPALFERLRIRGLRREPVYSSPAGLERTVQAQVMTMYGPARLVS